jgi:heme A synthase
MNLGSLVAAGFHGPDVATLLVLTLAAALTAVVAGLAVAAFVQRRSRPYLLVALALSALVARTVVGLGAYTAMLGTADHHLLEHGLDVVMAALVIAAVYLVRSNPTEATR